jgi:hypothetical protein
VTVEFRPAADRRCRSAAWQSHSGSGERRGCTEIGDEFRWVEYLSSSMLNQIIAVDNAIKKKGGQLRLCGSMRSQKVFTLMRLDKVLTPAARLTSGEGIMT